MSRFQRCPLCDFARLFPNDEAPLSFETEMQRAALVNQVQIAQ